MFRILFVFIILCLIVVFISANADPCGSGMELWEINSVTDIATNRFLITFSRYASPALPLPPDYQYRTYMCFSVGEKTTMKFGPMQSDGTRLYMYVKPTYENGVSMPYLPQ